MRIAVIGGNGQLGQDIVQRFRASGEAVAALDHAQIEVSDRKSVAAAFEATRPDLVINTAAMHHVDRCEEQPERAFAVNAAGARNLALECKERNEAKCITFNVSGHGFMDMQAYGEVLGM